MFTREKFLSALSMMAALALPSLNARAAVNFQKDIRPILSDNCFSCHGPDETNRKAKLRLDTKEGTFKLSEGKPIVKAGKSAESELMKRITSTDAEEVMPPPKSKKKLTEKQVALFKQWIVEGANYDEHWAFKSPERPVVPTTKDRKWAKTPVDSFILARLEKEGLKPSPEADRTTLIRRLYLDLIGLPPSIEEVDAFLNDKSADAYSKVVEHLLASSHYGERWGRHWLDAARYADSDGFEKDKARFVWNYRDWVIQAHNEDKPYNQFIIEQLAGDQLPNATQSQRVATGFLRNSMLNEEGGVDPEQFRMDAMYDRMDAVGKGMLGLTIQCAQCHTHKFDPITQEEYYKLFAFLNNDHEGTMVAYSAPEQMQISDITRKIRELEDGLRHTTSDWQERMNKWEEANRTLPTKWNVATVTNTSDGDQRYSELKDNSILAAGYAPTQFSTRMRTTNAVSGTIGAFRLELLNDSDLPSGGPGRSVKGLCALTEFHVEAVDAVNPTNKVSMKMVSATADFGNEERPLEPEFDNRSGRKRVTGPIQFAIDGNDDTAWGINAGPGRRNVPRNAVFVPEKPVSFPNGAYLAFELRQYHGGWNSDDNQNNNIGRFRLSYTDTTNAVADMIPARVREIFNTPRERRSEAQVAAVFSYWRTTVPEFKEANDKIEALWKQWPEGATTLSLMARADKRDTRILKRGDWLKPEKPVTAGTPAFLPPLPAGADDSRLTFAKWMVDPKAPTTARVFVNRIWQAYFGTGIVETPEDFGLQSPAPSHPELLDWLAVEFMQPTVLAQAAQPWSIKHLHRLIVHSAVYRQSSKVTDELYKKDQFNRLMARGPRLRVEGEIVRDVALYASGLLTTTIGGPPIFSPAPPSLFMPPNSYGPFEWKEATGPDRYRRAVYTFRRRSTPYPVLAAFDAPTGDASCVRRSRANTPLQALTVLNETVFMEASQALALKVLTEGGKTDEEKLTLAFRRVLSRQPGKDEISDLKNLLTKTRARAAEGWINPSELATGKTELPKLPPGATPTQLAAFTAVSRVLLNLDETITKE